MKTINEIRPPPSTRNTRDNHDTHLATMGLDTRLATWDFACISKTFRDTTNDLFKYCMESETEHYPPITPPPASSGITVIISTKTHLTFDRNGHLV